jgi:hypothetical protein
MLTSVMSIERVHTSITDVTCIRELPGFNLGRNTLHPEVFTVFVDTSPLRWGM